MDRQHATWDNGRKMITTLKIRTPNQFYCINPVHVVGLFYENVMFYPELCKMLIQVHGLVGVS